MGLRKQIKPVIVLTMAVFSLSAAPIELIAALYFLFTGRFDSFAGALLGAIINALIGWILLA